MMEKWNRIRICKLEQTRVRGINYLLVIDPEENDEENGSAAYILKEVYFPKMATKKAVLCS